MINDIIYVIIIILLIFCCFYCVFEKYIEKYICARSRLKKVHPIQSHSHPTI